MRRRLRRLALAAGLLVLLLAAAAAVPVTYVETSCGRGASPAPDGVQAIVDPSHRRAVGDSYLTYPEWFIVHAYVDLAGVTRRSSESRYDYAEAITTFWGSLCRATATARAVGPATTDQRVTDDVIGLSFTLEMALQGLYERTVGAATAWLRGTEKTPEDAFNQRFLDDYAAFLQQTPWYRYPFKDELVRFWRETPWSFRSPVRSAERRAALSLEYAAKALYAVAIGALAGAAPAGLTLQTVVKGPEGSRVDKVTLVRDLGNGTQLVETPRYAAYTEILKAWARTGVDVVEIAGNHRILVTVLAPRDTTPDLPGATPVFAIPIQSRPAWHRIGFDTDVSALTRVIAASAAQGATFEHAYDY